MPLPEKGWVMYAAGKAAVDMGGLAPQIVNALPETGKKGVLYLVANGGDPPNIYDEYIWISAEAGYEKMGQKEIDTSHFIRDSDIQFAADAQIEAAVEAAYNAEFPGGE